MYKIEIKAFGYKEGNKITNLLGIAYVTELKKKV